MKIIVLLITPAMIAAKIIIYQDNVISSFPGWDECKNAAATGLLNVQVHMYRHSWGNV